MVLSFAYWENRFGKDPGAINQTMVVNGQTMTIIGIAQDGFEWQTVGVSPQVYIPITMKELINPGDKVFDNRQLDWAYLFARLKPGGCAGAGPRGPEYSIPRNCKRD